MNTYDEIIPEFLSDDKLREALLKPALIGEHVYASNGHIAIKIPVSKLSKTYKVNPDYPAIIPLFEKRDGLFQSPKIYKAEDVFMTLKDIPQTKIEIECKDCEGTGESFVKDSSSLEVDKCKKCDGSGTIATDKYEYDWQNHKLQIGMAYFNPNYIQKLLRITEVNKTKEIQHISGTPIGQNLFVIDELEILIMPMRVLDADGQPQSYYIYHKLEEKKI